MSSTVYIPGKSPRTVKNLGWLLRHWKEVDSFTLAKLPDASGAMVAHLSNGGTFQTSWASAALMLEWCKRPVFRGVAGASADECISVTLDIEPEDIPVRGNVQASDNPEDDKAAEDEILRRLERGEDWAWCYVIVRGEVGYYRESDSLGGCSYSNEKDFMRGGYWEDMVRSVMDSIYSARVSSLWGA